MDGFQATLAGSGLAGKSTAEEGDAIVDKIPELQIRGVESRYAVVTFVAGDFKINWILGFGLELVMRRTG